MTHKNENQSCANGFGSLTNITEKGNDMAEANYTDFLKQKIKMATFKGFQAKSGELSPVLYPHQRDIVDRLIERYSNKGERVYDPFCGLGTVPYRAILKGRTGGGSELNTAYFMDQVHYLKSAEKEFSMPSLFDVLEEAEAA